MGADLSPTLTLLGALTLDNTTLDNTRQLKVLTAFCTKPGADQDKSRSGNVVHDWTYLIRQIAYFDHGKPCDDAVAKEVSKVLRKSSNFPNDSDWRKRVNAPGATERILEIIREGIAAGRALTATA
jgi:hypothetical protein